SFRETIFELVALCPGCIGTEHACGEAFESARYFQRISNGKASRFFKLQQVHHARAAVEAYADALGVYVPGMTGRTGQPDHVGFALAGDGIEGTGQPGE